MPSEDTGQEGRKMRRPNTRGSKTSKTAHVLGLLTNTASQEETPVPESYPAAPAAVPFIAPLAAAPLVTAPPAAPVPEVQVDDKTIEAQIRSALEEEWKTVEQELIQNTEQKPPVEKPLSAPEVPLEEPQAAPPEPEMDLADRSDFSQMPQRKELSIKGGDDSDVICFNIMQALVEAKADKYIRLFGLCTCDRCRIDVIALSMSNLPAKYMVVHNKDIVPLLSTYEARYNAAIVSQVMSACKQVMKHPRHNL